MTVRVIFFDLGDTLVQMSPAVLEDSAHQITALTGHPVSVADLQKAERAEWLERPPRDFLWVKTEDQERTFWENVFYPSVLRRLGISVYPQQLVSLLAARAMDPRSFVLFPEVREVLEELKRAGVELGIISNSFPSGERILESLKLTSYFGYVFWSHQCECAKPDRGIFHQALQCASCSQACTLFVDDRPEFVKAAMQAGMDLTFWINRNGYDGNIMQQIRSLWDIIPIVRGCQKITVLWEFALLESARSTAAAKRPDAGPSPVCAR